MKIRNIHTRIHTRRYDGALRMHHQSWTEKHAVLVFVEGDGGMMGLGEAWCDAGDPRIVKAYIDRDLAPSVIGMDARRPEAIWSALMRSRVMGQRGGALYAGAGAIDTGVWDLFARTIEVPLRMLLGGAQDSLPAYASGGFYGEGYGPDNLARDMMIGIDQGCIGVKVKAGLCAPQQEEARIAAVREAIGPDRWLMADFLFSPSVPQAISVASRCRPYDLRFLEAPTALENLPGWRTIGHATGLSLAGPEMASGLHMFRAAIEQARVNYLQLDVASCGGITEARRISGLAAVHGLPLTIHCSGSAVAFAANAQFGAGIAGDSIEFPLLHQSLFERLWRAGFTISGGMLHLPEAPGLGFELAPDDPELSN